MYVANHEELEDATPTWHG